MDNEFVYRVGRFDLKLIHLVAATRFGAFCGWAQIRVCSTDAGMLVAQLPFDPRVDHPSTAVVPQGGTVLRGEFVTDFYTFSKIYAKK